MADVVKMVEQASLPQMILNLSQSLADAQNALTQKAISFFIEMADPDKGVLLPGEQKKRSLIELGLEPSFMHITDAKISARVVFSTSDSTQWSVGAGVSAGYPGVFAASVNAGYANKYSFDAQSSSEITTHIVSVPAPPGFADRLRNIAAKKT